MNCYQSRGSWPLMWATHFMVIINSFGKWYRSNYAASLRNTVIHWNSQKFWWKKDIPLMIFSLPPWRYHDQLWYACTADCHWTKRYSFRGKNHDEMMAMICRYGRLMSIIWGDTTDAKERYNFILSYISLYIYNLLGIRLFQSLFNTSVLSECCWGANFCHLKWNRPL